MTQSQTTMKLTKANYHSREANQQYMSISQFKSFLECEARTVAELEGLYKRPSTNALLVGTYVHAAFDDPEAMTKFLEKNSDAVFKSRGKGKYADFEKADEMIETLKNDPFCMFALDGDKEQIYMANLWGVEWKIRVDSINHEHKYFSDIKTTQELTKRYWSEKYDGWVSFVEAWDYVLQMAVYRRVIAENLGQWYTPYIVAVTKESPPNKAVLHFEQSRFDFEYEYIENEIERIIQVKAGEVKPRRCEKCDYCRQSKQITDTIEIGELIYM